MSIRLPGTGYRCSLDSTLSGPPKKGGIFGGKNKINDPFFIGPSPGPSMDENVPQVAQEAGVVRWKGNHTPFTLTVGNPEKSSKLGGMKDWLNIHPLRDNFQKNIRKPIPESVLVVCLTGQFC